jgi:DNA replication and repair protein RecF
MSELSVESLTVRGFRNISQLEVSLGPRLNVISGDNGQGKTNLLEALYVLATSRSFRTTRAADLVTHGGDVASVRGAVREHGSVRQQTLGIRRGLREARVDGKRTSSLATYAVLTPVVVFHPGSLALAAGSGAERRRLLDRLALYRSPSTLAELAAYTKAMRGRQRILDVRSETGSDLDHWEELVARHALAVSQAREMAAVDLGAFAESAFREFASDGSALSLRYLRSGPADPEVFRATLAANRPRDRARGSATVGPHRDDLLLELGQRPVRGVASQGQHRAVVLALALAEISVIVALRKVEPVLLLDDVSSELDRHRTGALLRALGRRRGQILLTTTRPELIETSDSFPEAERRDFVVRSGRVANV